MEKLTMTVREMAATMGISLPTAYNLTEREGFPVIRVGKKKVIPTEQLMKWLEKETGAGRTA